MEVIGSGPGIRVQVHYKAGSLERISLFSSRKFSLDCPSAQIDPFRAWLKAYSQGHSQGQLYCGQHETLNLDSAKTPGFDDHKRVHIANMDPFMIVESREFSRGPKSMFHADRSMIPFSLPLPGNTLQGDVLRFLQTIPWGSVCSYKDVAKAVGSPRAARAVGNICRGNLFPLLIPCHRVIKSDGEIGRYTPDPSLKRQLLQFEGVTFSTTGTSS